MAYTQSALQSELSKQREVSVGWPWRLMTLSLVVLLTVVAVYVGMRFGFQELYLGKELKDAEETALKLTQSVTPEEQKQIFNFYSQLSNIDSLLDSRGKGIMYLDLVEKNTLKAVTYSDMDLVVSGQAVTIGLDGKATSYGSIVEQIDLYKKIPGVKEVNLSGAQVAGQAVDGIQFSLQIVVNR